MFTERRTGRQLRAIYFARTAMRGKPIQDHDGGVCFGAGTADGLELFHKKLQKIASAENRRFDIFD